MQTIASEIAPELGGLYCLFAGGSPPTQNKLLEWPGQRSESHCVLDSTIPRSLASLDKFPVSLIAQ
jgi:hypothetical protein